MLGLIVDDLTASDLLAPFSTDKLIEELSARVLRAA